MSLQTEEIKTDELKDKDSVENKKTHGKVLKIACASGGFIAVVALCILSSRFSWFGVQADNEGISYSESVSSYSSTTPAGSEKVPTKANKPDITSETTAATTSVTTDVETTTTPKSTTTPKATTTATSKTTKATSKTTPATTAAPKPAWTEQKCSGTMYINISSCSARKEGLQGSEVVSYKYYGDAVKVTAITDTGYYKLDDGSYVHSDYLSKTKPAETTTVTTTAKPVSTPTQNNNTDTSSNITDQPVNCTAEEAEVFRLVNEYRAQYGIAPVKWDQNAYKAAKIRCDEITTNFSHKRNGGQRFYTVYSEIMQERLYNYGENIASGQSTAQDVLNSWMNSELHRKNILDPDFDNLAVAFGIYNDSYKYYWVQEFTTY
ncbi:MAG: CAP domain-containing protein [Ruminiclostridium sp.]|nr:CAP domain-containing protein [Ruminiclostridium sp.]